MTESNSPKERDSDFFDLLPLIVALAGLPTSEKGKYFTEDQIEARVFTIRHAYRHAKILSNELPES